MSRKDKSFLQLYNYLNKEKLKGYDNFILHNLYSNQKFYMMKSFYENSNLLRHKKNCNFLYHEIITLKQNIKNVSLEKQKYILKDLGNKYLSQRAKYNLAYGVIHQDKEHIHLHLMISANELGVKRRHFLKKKAFNKIEKDLENYYLEQYPELEEKALLNKKKSKQYKKASSKNKEVNYKKRVGKQSKKDLFKAKLQELFKNTKSIEIFLKNLQDKNIKIYTRANNIGFIDLASNKKYRLKTLELEQEFNLMSERIEQTRQKEYSKGSEQEPQHKKQTKDHKNKLETRIKELESIAEQKTLNKDKDFDF